MRGKRKLQERLEAEPEARRGLPDCPRHLKGRARSTWNFWVEELAVMNLDHRPDGPMLEGACLNYARAVEADLIVAREGIMVEENTIDADTGEKILLRIKAHPAVGVSTRAWSQVRSFCSEFGLSPVSRTRLVLQAVEKKPEDLMSLLSTPRERRAKEETVQ